MSRAFRLETEADALERAAWSNCSNVHSTWDDHVIFKGWVIHRKERFLYPLYCVIRPYRDTTYHRNVAFRSNSPSSTHNCPFGLGTSRDHECISAESAEDVLAIISAATAWEDAAGPG